MILSKFSVDIGPLIAGAGILGVAVGFGGQYLVKDLITGIFIIIEKNAKIKISPKIIKHRKLTGMFKTSSPSSVAAKILKNHPIKKINTEK